MVRTPIEKTLWRVARFGALVALIISSTFSLALAFHGYNASHEVGAGAAQSDLGFFMILLVASPVIFFITALSFWINRLAIRKLSQIGSPFEIASMLTAFSIFMIFWNWFFLLFFWVR